MNKLLSIAVLSLAFSGFALADDVGDFSGVRATQGQSYDGQELSRNEAPVPVPSMNGKGVASLEIGSGRA